MTEDYKNKLIALGEKLYKMVYPADDTGLPEEYKRMIEGGNRHNRFNSKLLYLLGFIDALKHETPNSKTNP